MKYLLCLITLMLTSNLFAEAALNQLTDSEQRSGWKLLFDGKSTDGWRNYRKDNLSDGWKIIDGALVRVRPYLPRASAPDFTDACTRI